MENPTPSFQPAIFIFNDIQLSCPILDGHRMIPVKTVCDIIDVQFKVQDNWLKSHQIFAQLYRLHGATGADGKQYQMNCLPIFDLYAWLSSIKNDKRRDGSLKKQFAFMAFIREKMIEEYKSIQVFEKENQYELELVELKDQTEAELNTAKSLVKDLQNKVKKLDQSIEEIRVNRLV